MRAFAAGLDVFNSWFDQRFVRAIATSRRVTVVRLVIIAIDGALLGLISPLRLALGWMFVALAAEALTFWVTWPYGRRATTRRDDWLSFAAYAFAITAWSTVGWQLWMSPRPAAHVAAILFLAAHLLYISRHHCTSPGMLAPSLPALLIPLLGIVLDPHCAGRDKLLTLMMCWAVGAYTLAAMLAGLRAARDLQTATGKMHDASRAKDAFLANVSHELRTPLNGVLGMAHVLGRDPTTSAAQREKLDIITASGTSLLKILNDILDSAKIAEGKVELNEVEFSLADVLQASRGAFASLALEKGVRLDLDADAEALGRYLGDPVRIQQVVGNLLSNAVKFTARGSVTLRVRPTGDSLSLEVIDTGIGISPEAADRLFQRFTQVDASTTRTYGGTGLGLSISRDLVRAMGGTLEVESRPGQGSCFSVRLPLVRLGDEVEAAGGAAADDAQAGALRILAAEDNPVNRQVLAALLGHLGVTLDLVEDGRQALLAWRAATYDIILMDIQMPVMDGVLATRSIRAAEAECGRLRTPIVAVTANVMPSQLAEYQAAGIDACVAKPISVAELIASITRVAGGAQGAAGPAALAAAY